LNSIERTLAGLTGAMDHTFAAESHAEARGLLQGIDPRVKLGGLCCLILAAVSVTQLAVCACLLILAIALALASGIAIRTLCLRVWLGVLLFTGPVVFPAIFTIPGRALSVVPWVHWTITLQGVHSAVRLLLRAETAATLAALLVLTTPWNHVLKAMRVFRIPVAVVVLLGMTHRYVTLLLQIARDFFEARRCRVVSRLTPARQRHLMAATTGVLLGRSLQLSEDVHAAMQARGYRGEPRILDEFRMNPRDWVAAAGFLGITLLAFWLGRQTR
jgi:cobalt ECF transporter T component CbiQ